MINAMRGEVEVAVGERVYVARLSTDAIVTAETILNAGLQDIIDGCSRGRLGYIIAVLWAALRERHPEITRDDVKRWLDTYGAATFATALGQLMERSTVIRGPEAGDAGNGPATAAA